MATHSLNLTKENIEKITFPEIKQNVYVDTKENGLILIVSYGKSKVFYLRATIDGRYRKIKLGSFPSMSLTQARAKAGDFKNQIVKGIDPTTKLTTPQQDEEMTFKQLFDKYIEDYAVHNTKSWKADIADINNKAYHLYNNKISSITKNDVQQAFNNSTIKGKYGANRFLDRIRTVFNKAIEWELLDKNPTSGIKKHKEKSRDRYLLAEEEQLFFDVLEKETNETIKDFILISLYTAARKSNVLAMRWDNISVNNKTWYMPDTKNGEPHLVPLMDKAFQILEKRYKKRGSSEWVFPSNLSKSGHLEDPKKTWDKLRKQASLKDFRLHDLRRTMGSWMAISGASQYVIGKALNHKSPRSTAIYARLSIDPVREYMEKAGKLFNKTKEEKINSHKRQDEIKIASNNSVDALQANDNTEVLERKIAELEQQIAALKSKQGLQSE